MQKRSLKSIALYKTVYSKVTSIGLWMLFLLKTVLKNKTHDRSSNNLCFSDVFLRQIFQLEEQNF